MRPIACIKGMLGSDPNLKYLASQRKNNMNIYHRFSRSRPQVRSKKASRKACQARCTCRSHTFSAFWLRSSVVSVLISLISDTRCIASFEINSISPSGLPNRLLAAWVVTRGLGVALFPRLRTATPLKPKDNDFKF